MDRNRPSRGASPTCLRVALCEEGVDRNNITWALGQVSGVALCEEGVDRNLIASNIWSALNVALCEEGVDRNSNVAPHFLQVQIVALCEEGVDRNICCRAFQASNYAVALCEEGVDRNPLLDEPLIAALGRPLRRGRG